MISEERLTRALKFLAKTDKRAAKLKVDVARSEYRCRLARAAGFLESDGNIKERESQAEISYKVRKSESKRLGAIGRYEHLKAKRATEEWVVEVWRSLNANRRQGNIT